MKTYPIHFPLDGEKCGLESTDQCKVVEARLHNVDYYKGPERITVLYKDLGSFTFLLQERKNMEQMVNWEGTIQGR